MQSGLVYDERFLEHTTGRSHVERPERLQAIVQALQEAGLWNRLLKIQAMPADWRWIERVHDRAYIRRLRAACEENQPWIDTPDSAICPSSGDVARVAVGGVLAAVDAVMARRMRHAFCAVRPPGHHAESDQSMGFCLFNNIAITTEYLRLHHGLERVAIVDFDVHHGNGTQHFFEARPDVLFISLHEDPRYLYPGTGFSHETGVGQGEHYTMNLPVAPDSGDDTYRRLFEERVLPALDRFKPEMRLISAGFDAADADPLAHIRLTDDGFAWMTRVLLDAADRLCKQRLVSVLEGGYDLASLGACVTAHVSTLIEYGRT